MTLASEVVNNLGALIENALKGYQFAYYTPTFDSDKMDAQLKFYKNQAKELRRLRNEFEEVMYGLEGARLQEP